jgi:hypothetical protein
MMWMATFWLKKSIVARNEVDVPIFADETAKTSHDVAKLAGAIDGVVVKTMKSEGIRESDADDPHRSRARYENHVELHGRVVSGSHCRGAFGSAVRLRRFGRTVVDQERSISRGDV